MASWWQRDMIAPGKLPLMLCFLAFVVTFAVTRTITRMIRDGRGPFRNQVTASGTHIHHSVPGIILLIIGAFTAVGGPDALVRRGGGRYRHVARAGRVRPDPASAGRLLERRGPAVGRGGEPDGRLSRPGPRRVQPIRRPGRRRHRAVPAADRHRDPQL